MNDTVPSQPPHNAERNEPPKPEQPNQIRQASKNTKGKASASSCAQPELMRFQECALDADVCIKTIRRWVDKGFLTEWRPHPDSRTRRIKRPVWEAFKQRFR